eukprot:5629984-Pyramimonas_sp.AAC.1
MIGRPTTLYDATSAFHSVKHGYLHAYVDDHCDAFGAELFKQRMRFAQVSIECADGKLVMGIGQGTLPGDAVSCIWFLGAYCKPLDVFRDTDATSLYVRMKWL